MAAAAGRSGVAASRDTPLETAPYSSSLETAPYSSLETAPYPPLEAAADAPWWEALRVPRAATSARDHLERVESATLQERRRLDFVTLIVGQLIRKYVLEEREVAVSAPSMVAVMRSRGRAHTHA